MREPVIVLGTGRSGTSYCSMLLHTRLNVNMGNEQWIGNGWVPNNWNHTKGNWERASTRILLHTLKRCPETSPYLLVELIHELKQVYGDKPWGFKHPDFTLYLPILLEHFPKAYYINCKRKPREVANSMENNNYDLQNGKQDYFLRAITYQKQLEKQLSKTENNIVINLDEYRILGVDNVLNKLSSFLDLPVLDIPINEPGEPYFEHGPIGGLILGKNKNIKVV